LEQFRLIAFACPVYGDAMSVIRRRVILQVDDFDEALAFFSRALGLPATAACEGGARVAILEAGRATLEIANRAQVAMIDSVEVGRPISPQMRLAFEVSDTRAEQALSITTAVRSESGPTIRTLPIGGS
jgi:hypothetical protein